MKKRTFYIISIILLLVSFSIVFVKGKTQTITLHNININDISITCDSDYIKCDYKEKKNKIKITVKPVKSGETIMHLKSDKKVFYENKKERNYTFYIHKTGIITLGSYFGRCNGDISLIISFNIIIILAVIYLIGRLRRGIKNNLYSYSNAATLGMLLFIIIPTIFRLFFFVFDYFVLGYHQTVGMFMGDIKDSSYLFMLFVFPLAIILNLLVTFSNINLVIKEGKSYKNMLGIILGLFINMAVIFLIIFSTLFSFNKILMIVSDVFSSYLVYFECLFIGTSILGIKTARHVPKYDKDAIIILGCQINKDGSLPPLLKSRVERAIEFSKMQKENTGKDIIFIPSGGQGKDEIMSEAKAMKNYLIENGISKDKIIIEDKSTTTYENINNSYKLITKKIKDPKLAFSTTNYHTLRAGIIATKQNIDIEGMGSKTRAYFWVNAFVREFIATIVSERKTHLKALLLLGIIVIVLAITTHL